MPTWRAAKQELRSLPVDGTAPLRPFSHPMDFAGLSYGHEPLAEALAIRQAAGDAGPVWIAVRIGALAAAGDVAGLRRFLLIAVEYGRLIGTAH